MKYILPSFRGRSVSEILTFIKQIPEFSAGNPIDELDFSKTELFELNHDRSTTENFMLPISGIIEIINAIPEHILHLNLSECRICYANTGSSGYNGRVNYEQANLLYSAIGNQRFKEITFRGELFGAMPNLDQLVGKLQQERVNLSNCRLSQAPSLLLNSTAQSISDKITHLNISRNGLGDCDFSILMYKSGDSTYSMIENFISILASKNLQVINVGDNFSQNSKHLSPSEIASIFVLLPESCSIIGLDTAINQELLSLRSKTEIIEKSRMIAEGVKSPSSFFTYIRDGVKEHIAGYSGIYGDHSIKNAKEPAKDFNRSTPIIYDSKPSNIDWLENDLNGEMIRFIVLHIAKIEHETDNRLHSAARQLLKNYLNYLSSFEDDVIFKSMTILRTQLGFFDPYTNKILKDIEQGGEKHRVIVKEDADLIEQLRTIAQDQKSKVSQVIPQTMSTGLSRGENSLLFLGTGRRFVPSQQTILTLIEQTGKRVKNNFSSNKEQKILTSRKERKFMFGFITSKSPSPPPSNPASNEQLHQAVDKSLSLFTKNDLIGMSNTKIIALTDPRCLAAIQEGLFDIDDIKRIQAAQDIYALIRPTSLIAMRNGLFTLADLIGMSDGAIYHLTHPSSLVVIQEGLFKIADIKVFDTYGIVSLLEPHSITAIRDGLFTLSDLAGLCGNVIAALLNPACLAAIRENRTSLHLLVDMTISDLHAANRTGNYPKPPGLTK
jgi:hypothetical protein